MYQFALEFTKGKDRNGKGMLLQAFLLEKAGHGYDQLNEVYFFFLFAMVYRTGQEETDVAWYGGQMSDGLTNDSSVRGLIQALLKQQVVSF